MKPNVHDPEYEIIDSRTNGPLDMEKALDAATSGEEIQSLLRVGNNAKPSGTLRRRWLRASARAYERVRQARDAQDVLDAQDVSSRAAGVEEVQPVEPQFVGSEDFRDVQPRNAEENQQP